MKFNTVDLFCGAGGTSVGLQRAGFDIDVSVDNSEEAIDTYRANHEETECLKRDIREVEAKDLETDDPLLVAGSPPCQLFSNANRHKGKESEEKYLYQEMKRLVSGLEPNFVLMENVRGMNQISDQIKREFDAQGYMLEEVILNSRDFGVPQNRERLFFLGIRKDAYSKSPEMILNKLKINILKKRKSDEVPLKKTFWGLRELSPREEKLSTDIESEKTGMTVDTLNSDGEPNSYVKKINMGEIPEKVYNHKARYHNERDRKIYRTLPEGENAEHESIQDIMPYKLGSFKDKYYKLEEDSPCKTITAHMEKDCNSYIHPREHRGLTPREAARIQSFPDDYHFQGSFTSWYRQIGNAVPPLLAEKLGESVIETHQSMN